MLDKEWFRGWDKANNCKDIVYKLELVEWLNKWIEKSWQKDFLNIKSHTPPDAKLLVGGVKRIERCLAFKCSAYWIRNTEEKTNTTRSTVLELVEDLGGYKMELTESDLWRN